MNAPPPLDPRDREVVGVPSRPPLFAVSRPPHVADTRVLCSRFQITWSVDTFAVVALAPTGKSLAPYLVALLLRFTGQRLNELQWVCIMLQCILIAITQYNSCQSATVLPFKAYALLATSTCITAVSSVWNQKVIKGFAVPVNLQNALLYIFGFVIAVISYVAFPDRTHPERGFFEGYGESVLGASCAVLRGGVSACGC